MRTIAVFNQKGGCGKTTTAIHLAACLAEAGKRTLIVDLDAQAHATMGCNVKQADVECSTFDCLVDREDGCAPLSLADIAWEVLPQLFLAPGSIMLSSVEQRLAGAARREERLREALARSKQVYEWAVIDCGPAMSLLSINAVRAADTVLIPAETGFFCLQSVERARDTVKLVAERTGHRPRVMVVPTMYDPRTKSDRAAYRQMRTQFAAELSETTVRFNAKLKEAAAAGSPITEFFPGCRGHKDYQALTQELMADTFALQLEAAQAAAQVAAVSESAAVSQLTEELLGPQTVADGVQFVARAPGAKRVQLAGNFNGWNPEAGAMWHDEGDGHTWRLKLPLGQGRYEYRLVIDGRWVADPANPNSAQNEFGEFNSLLEVAKN
jgi:chromosome partitioning protein